VNEGCSGDGRRRPPGEATGGPAGRAYRLPRALSTALIACCAAALGLAAGTLLQHPSIPPGSAGEFVEVRESGFGLVNPILECERPRHSAENERLDAVRHRVEGVVRAAEAAGRVAHASVYFRALDTGTWFSVNPVEDFVPASLLKVPVLMAVLRAAESDPGLLERRLRYDGRDDLAAEQSVKPSVLLEPGRDYPMRELLRRMIVASDNNSARLVLESLPPGELERTYEALGVRFDGARGDESFISVDAYASFFRILYNASFLGPRESERALGLLTAAEYADGLRAGVPAEVPVAHKFGEWRLRETDPAREQLHDCGIVYAPGRPYLLCVMTRGASFEPLGGVIADLSRVAYEEWGREPELFALDGATSAP
jgi:beta-lactamase class A